MLQIDVKSSLRYTRSDMRSSFRRGYCNQSYTHTRIGNTRVFLFYMLELHIILHMFAITRISTIRIIGVYEVVAENQMRRNTVRKRANSKCIYVSLY